MNWSGKFIGTTSLAPGIITNAARTSYRIGDTFTHLPLPTAQKLLEESGTEVDSEVSRLEDEISSMKEQMDALKAHLYARFGRGINLEG